MEKIAIIPGSFDPITNGHLDVIARSAKLFDKVYVAVLNNNVKSPLFSAEERVELIKRVTGNFDNVCVECFSGLLVDFAKKKNAHFIVKGLRAVSDFEYEFQMALANKELAEEIETFFIASSPRFSYLSSSIVKELARHNAPLTNLVPNEIINDIQQKFNNV
ncbi:MAG: pantetheine-phosphate adenylyltransferase [Clostridia bacterium]|nr:pantetheine-phosphate adenylyltransferase [Clostridia bacterium]